jgi:hypothetical protein
MKRAFQGRVNAEQKRPENKHAVSARIVYPGETVSTVRLGTALHSSSSHLLNHYISVGTFVKAYALFLILSNSSSLTPSLLTGPVGLQSPRNGVFLAILGCCVPQRHVRACGMHINSPTL